jgi:hypothetical protein
MLIPSVLSFIQGFKVSGIEGRVSDNSKGNAPKGSKDLSSYLPLVGKVVFLGMVKLVNCDVFFAKNLALIGL